MPTPHIESKNEDISKLVLMPGDPKRSTYIAEKYLKDYKLVNDVRGMKAYTGYYKDKLVTIFPSGMGIPSMGIYSYELFNNYNVDVIIRIGTMGSYSKEADLKSIVASEKSYSTSNYGVELTNEKKEYETCSKELLNEMIVTSNRLETMLHVGNVESVEAFYGDSDFNKKRDEKGILGVEMESFALYTNANYLNKKALAVFTVSDSFLHDKKLTSEEREKSLDEMIILALETIINI